MKTENLLTDNMIEREANRVAYNARLINSYSGITCKIGYISGSDEKSICITYKSKYVASILTIEELEMSLDDFSENVLKKLIFKLAQSLQAFTPQQELKYSMTYSPTLWI